MLCKYFSLDQHHSQAKSDHYLVSINSSIFNILRISNKDNKYAVTWIKYLETEKLYKEGMDRYNMSHKVSERLLKAFKVLDQAANLNHTGAQEMVAFAYLFGDHLRFNPRLARDIFEKLAVKGSPRGQMGLGFIYSAGIYANSSQAKALVYFTFAALGGDHWAQMALGYRYWSGISVTQNCEAALTYYRKVAETVASEVQFIGGPAIQRIRLADEIENPNSQSSQLLMDDNLLQYYKFLADKGDIQAQIGLGQLYLNGGRGVEQNHYYAHYYLRMAAENGNSNANAYLGKMYLDGTPATVADNSTAFEYFKKAADKFQFLGKLKIIFSFMTSD
uniref:Uncharacterized protein n=1 Tax=Romanomermis culicivorax TaxID=13658 RepID=A0A915HW00_ROMCU